MWGVSLTHPVLVSLFISCVSLTQTTTQEKTSHAGFIFIWGIFLTHPMLALFFCGEFLWHIPCRLLFLIRGVSLTHPVLFSFLSAESLLNIPCCFIFIWGVSLTHPMLTLFLCGEFSYTSHNYYFYFLFYFLSWEVSLTHPVFVSFFFSFLGSFYYTSRAGFILSGEFLLHIPCWLNFYLGSFSYTSLTGFIFLWGVSLTHSHAGFNYIRGLSLIHRMLALLFCSEFLLHILCYLYFCAGSLSD